MNLPLSSALVLEHVEHINMLFKQLVFSAPNVSGEKELVSPLGRFPSLSSPCLASANTLHFGILIPPLLSDALSLSCLITNDQQHRQHSAHHPSTAEAPNSIPGPGLAMPGMPGMPISGVAGGFLGGSSATPRKLLGWPSPWG